MAKHKSNRNRILLIAAIIAVAGLGIWYATRAKSPTAKKTTPATETKQTASADTTKTDATIDKDAPASTTTSSTTTSSKPLYITINSPVPNDNIALSKGLQPYATVSGTLSGSCSLTATGPGGRVVAKSGTMTAQTSYGSCSFDIASSELVAGDWTLVIKATSGDSTGSASVKVTVK